jgi:hypothetical protein
MVPTIDLRILHLIRDSRAVAFSWRRRVPRPEYDHIPMLRGTHMAKMTPTKAAIHWNARNILFHALGVSGIPTRRLRYEDFVANPSPYAAALARWCEIPISKDRLSILAAREYESQTRHSVAGNRIRFKYGRVPIRLDAEWHKAMRAEDRLFVTALTLPLLHSYGYRASPRTARLTHS